MSSARARLDLGQTSARASARASGGPAPARCPSQRIARPAWLSLAELSSGLSEQTTLTLLRGLWWQTPRLALLARVDLHSGAPLFAPSHHKQDGGREGGRERGRDGGRAHSTRRGGEHYERHHHSHTDYRQPSYPLHYAPQPYMPTPHFGGGLGESLFTLVLSRVGEHAGKVTGMLLQSAEPSAVLALIQGPPQMLDEAVAEAVCMLGLGGQPTKQVAPMRAFTATAAHSAAAGAAAVGAAACVACVPCGQSGSGGGEAEAAAEAVVEVAAGGEEREESGLRGGGAVAEEMGRCSLGPTSPTSPTSTGTGTGKGRGRGKGTGTGTGTGTGSAVGTRGYEYVAYKRAEAEGVATSGEKPTVLRGELVGSPTTEIVAGVRLANDLDRGDDGGEDGEGGGGGEDGEGGGGGGGGGDAVNSNGRCS